MNPSDLGLPSDLFPSYRRGQESLILDLATSESRFKILQAPTGAGKSLVNVSYGLFEGYRTLYLTGTKGLQTQLLKDFESSGMRDIRGHRNYPCASKSTTHLDEDLCTWPPEECAHKKAMDVAASSDLVVSNYAKWVTMSRHVGRPQDLGDFDLLICDEAHTVLNWMTSLLSVELSSSQVRDLIDQKLPSPDDPIDTWIEWAKESVIKAEIEHQKLKDSSPGSSRIKRLVRLGKDLRQLSLLHKDRSEWVVDKTNWGASILPVSPSEYTEEHLFRGIPNIVLSSADVNEYDARDLGIKSSQLDVCESPFSFPPENRPIYWLDMKPSIRVQRNMPDVHKRLWVQRIDRTLEAFQDHKSIIQPRSYSRCKEIMEMSKWSRHMITHKPGGLEDALKRFRASSPPSVLISPTIEEGVDFPYDEARLCIIAKVPFVYSGDPLTKARKSKDKTYTDRMVCRDILQMAGRTMRAEDDWTVVVIPDDHWGYFQHKPYFPKWLREAFRHTSQIPEPLED